MKNINKPDLNAKEVFLDCISKVNDDYLKTKLMSIQDIIQSSENIYETSVIQNILHTLPKNNTVGTVTKEEMKKVYTYRMVHKEQPGRRYYDEILSLAPRGKCPLCKQRIATTLDHHLAKTEYPEFVVTPINLVPACKDCNKTKDTFSPSQCNEETLHPYYDNIDNEVWLEAIVIQTKPININYRTICVDNFTTVLNERIKNHFNILEISSLYSSHAAEELSNIYYRIHDLYCEIGSTGIKEHLYEEYSSRFRVDMNSWQTALYKALYESDWFCNGGYINILDN